jgi:phage baseplate assembly protein W
MSKGVGFYGEEFFVIKSGADLVSESIHRIIMTNTGERVSNPYFGVNLRDFVFEPNDDISKKQIITNLRQQLTQYETRASIGPITIEQIDNSMVIGIQFMLNEDKDKKIEEVKIQFVKEE